MHVGHNLNVGAAATLALGCAPGSNGPPPIAPCFFTTTDDTVGGNITADQPETMYLTAARVGGNVVSEGGGFSWRVGKADRVPGSARCGTRSRATSSCENNIPAAPYGDAYGEAPGEGPNVVGHKALGECASLTTPPASG